jgi:hypothetical protein
VNGLELKKCDSLKEFNGVYALEHYSVLSSLSGENDRINFCGSSYSVVLYSCTSIGLQGGG